MRKFICGFLCGAILCGSIAFAASYLANPVDFKVLVNGKEFVSDPPALEVEGRTYLPLRAIGEALGVPVDWNEELRQAEVGIISNTTDSEEQNTNYGLERSNPIPLNKEQTLVFVNDNNESIYTIKFLISECKRTTEAYNIISKSNKFFSTPAAGNSYGLIKLKVELVDCIENGSLYLSRNSVYSCNSNGTEYDQFYSSFENYYYSEFPSVTLTKNAKAEGYIPIQICNTDDNPLIRISIGALNVWCSLKQ